MHLLLVPHTEAKRHST